MVHFFRQLFVIGLVLCSVFLSSCGKKDDDGAAEISSAELSETANAASDQAIALAQSFDAASYAQIEKNQPLQSAKLLKFRSFLLPQAQAAACSTGGSNTSACSGSAPYTVIRTYSDCNLGETSLTMSGSATYTYSHSGCSMIGVTNRTVTRTTDLILTGKSGGTLSISSDNSTDYRGNTLGGGQTLSVSATSGQFSYSVGGVSRVLTGPQGKTLFDIATRTTSPITATGTSLSDLVLDGGALEIIHNRAEYVLTLAADNVAFSSSCACPVSGTMTGSYSGSVSGTMTITFTGCGAAAVSTSHGISSDVTIDACAY